MTSSWFFILQLSQDARSNKHQIHESRILCAHVDSFTVTMKCPFCLDCSAIFRGGNPATSVYMTEVCGRCIVLIRLLVQETHGERKQGTTTGSRPIRTVGRNSSSLLQQLISETYACRATPCVIGSITTNKAAKCHHCSPGT